MTVRDVIRRVLALLGHTETRADGEVPGGNDLYRRVLPLVHQIAAELWYRDHTEPLPALELGSTVPLSPVLAQTVLPYGVAMLLAQADGDVDNQTLYATLYDARRIPSAVGETITDIWDEVTE